jgi:hypothetical protein
MEGSKKENRFLFFCDRLELKRDLVDETLKTNKK